MTDAEIEIVQDYECDGDEDLGGPLAVFWGRGHGHDPRGFIRSVVDYCLDNDADLPALDAGIEPEEMWQQNLDRGSAVVYQRTDQAPSSPRSQLFPITILDCERPRRRVGRKCSVRGCSEPWSTGQPVRVCVEPGSGEAELGSPYMAAELWLCREHRQRMPEPSYRVCMIPVGATILLPSTADAAVSG